MTYSLHTLHGNAYESPPAAPTGWARFATEIAIIAGFLGLAFAILALGSYSLQDAAWSTSGAGGATLNHAGRAGALVADLLYYLFGYSAWWLVAVLAFFIAPFFGAVYGIIEKIRTKDSSIAYGPFLVLGSLVSLFWGEEIIRWILQGGLSL